VGLSEFLPFLLLVMLGGHVADHADRRDVLVIAWSIEALCIGVLLWLTLAGGQAVWPIYLVIVAFGSTRAFYAPAMQALTPTLVPREEFPHAVALNSTLFQTASISGPAVGGALYLLGPSVVFGACLGLFVVAVLLTMSLGPHRAAQRDTADARPTDGHALLEGLRYVLHQRVVLASSRSICSPYCSGVRRRCCLFTPPRCCTSVRWAWGYCAVLRVWRAPRGGHTGTAAHQPARRRLDVWRRRGLRDRYAYLWSVAQRAAVGRGAVAAWLRRYGERVRARHPGAAQYPDVIRGRVSAINSMFIGGSNELGEFESGATARWFGAVRAVLLGGALTLAVVVSWMGLFPELRRLDRLR